MDNLKLQAHSEALKRQVEIEIAIWEARETWMTTIAGSLTRREVASTLRRIEAMAIRAPCLFNPETVQCTCSNYRLLDSMPLGHHFPGHKS
jgi:hypothetical protein